MAITLGEFIKDLRESKKISQRELSRIAKVSNSTISRIENNENIPDISTLKNIATALNVESGIFLEKAGYIQTVDDKDIMYKEYFDILKEVFIRTAELYATDGTKMIRDVLDEGTGETILKNFFDITIDNIQVNKLNNESIVHFKDNKDAENDCEQGKTIVPISREKIYLNKYLSLNSAGQAKVEEYIDDLIVTGKYCPIKDLNDTELSKELTPEQKNSINKELEIYKKELVDAAKGEISIASQITKDKKLNTG